jgi:hypothetical protein
MKLPQRDLWLLPLVAVMTVVVMLAAGEIGTRAMFVEQEHDACLVPDPPSGLRAAPNCTSRMKAAEGPWYTNTYNDCGYRSPDSCAPVLNGTRRIALVGSSVTAGYLTPYDETVAGRLRADLSAYCHASVQAQNLGGAGDSGLLWVRRMDEALRLHPQLALTLVTPFDLESLNPTNVPNAAVAPAANAVQPHVSLQKRLFETLKHSRLVLALQHYLFRKIAVYLPLYLQYGDKADFLRPPFSPAWKSRLRALDTIISELADRAHRAGVAYMLVFVPQQAQLVLLAGHEIPPGIDPAALGHALAAMAARHDILFVDASEVLRRQPDPVNLYYQVDAHPTGESQMIIADDLAQRIVGGLVPTFADCRSEITQVLPRR